MVAKRGKQRAGRCRASPISGLLCAVLCAVAAGPVSVQAQAYRDGTEEGTSRQALIQELFDYVRFLQEELRQLRGQMEQQNATLEALRQRQTRQYLELEARLQSLEQLQQSNAETDPALAIAEQNAAEESRAYLVAYEQVKAGRYLEARQAFQRYLVEWPGGENAPNAIYWLGDLALAAVPVELPDALVYFERLVQDFPEHTRVPDALFKQGNILHLQGERTRSRELLERVVRSYSGVPGSAAARLAASYLRQHF